MSYIKENKEKEKESLSIIEQYGGVQYFLGRIWMYIKSKSKSIIILGQHEWLFLLHQL